jgi:primosomal replication protein N
VTANRAELRGLLIGREPLRYSPAGVPILSGLLQHASSQAEAGTDRQVELEIGLVFAGTQALAADRLALGAQLRVAGFLAPRRRQSKQLVMHVTEFESIEV